MKFSNQVLLHPWLSIIAHASPESTSIILLTPQYPTAGLWRAKATRTRRNAGRRHCGWFSLKKSFCGKVLGISDYKTQEIYWRKAREGKCHQVQLIILYFYQEWLTKRKQQQQKQQQVCCHNMVVYKNMTGKWNVLVPTCLSACSGTKSIYPLLLPTPLIHLYLLFVFSPSSLSFHLYFNSPFFPGKCAFKFLPKPPTSLVSQTVKLEIFICN